MSLSWTSPPGSLQGRSRKKVAASPGHEPGGFWGLGLGCFKGAITGTLNFKGAGKRAMRLFFEGSIKGATKGLGTGGLSGLGLC